MKSELIPIIRILMYLASGWLAARGVPLPVIDLITKDPAMIHLASEAAGQVLAAIITAGSLIWWRISKRMGWAT